MMMHLFVVHALMGVSQSAVNAKRSRGVTIEIFGTSNLKNCAHPNRQRIYQTSRIVMGNSSIQYSQSQIPKKPSWERKFHMNAMKNVPVRSEKTTRRIRAQITWYKMVSKST